MYEIISKEQTDAISFWVARTIFFVVGILLMQSQIKNLDFFIQNWKIILGMLICFYITIDVMYTYLPNKWTGMRQKVKPGKS